MLNYNYEAGIPVISKYSGVQTYNRLNSPNPEPFSYPMPEQLFSQPLSEAYSAKTKNSEDIVGEIFEDKLHALKTTIESILAQIEQRKKFTKNNLLSLLRGECKCDTELMQLEDKLKYSGAAGPGADKAKATAQKELLNLERERRFEGVSCWRDLVFLRKELVNTLSEYKTALRKQAMLSGK